MDHTSEMVTRLLLASLLGGLIGIEREIHGRAAGFRTHLLVSLGSCLFVVCSIGFYEIYGNFSGTGAVGVDPGRIAAQVVTGIGFLGAGAIIREGSSVRGLTTAACLWMAAGVGMVSGLGLYVISVIVTIVALISLMLLKKLESIFYRDTYSVICVDCADGVSRMKEIEQTIHDAGAAVMAVGATKDQERKELHLEFEVRLKQRSEVSIILDTISAHEAVRRVRMARVPQRLTRDKLPK